MKKIVVLISGSGSNLEAIIESCAAKNINGRVIHVISNNPDAYGLTRAAKFNIPSTIIDHKKFSSRIDFENSLEDCLDTLSPDLIVLAGFMRILGTKITSKFSNKMINLHPSLLPMYPGLHTHEKVLENKDTHHGISIHYVSSELDAGPLIAQGFIDISKDETLENIIKRIHKIEHSLLPEIINEICNENIYLDNNEVKYRNINLHNHKLIKRSYEI
ncbi:phosphoribosylglycinamide formyltransferase [Gammaproteobacteria bacterium]|nr:phosphoribosylglycinamide formyltransferase [Gammaproteobacteria bacterium]